MSNIISMFGEDLFDNNEFGQVFEAPLWSAFGTDGNQRQVKTHKSIVDSNGNPIAVVGSKYKLVQNREIVPQFEVALKQSGLDLTGITRNVSQSYQGARTVVRYRLPAHTIQIGRSSDDVVNLELSLLNSYDGSWSFRTMVGAFRMLCTNGMVIGKNFAHFYGKHTKNLDPQEAIMNVRHAAQTYLENAEVWKTMAGREITINEALEFFERVAGGDDNAMYKYLTTAHIKYVAEMGSTVWAVFNCLTDWSTHAASKKTKDENMSALIQKREDKVRQYVPQLMKMAA